MSAEVGHPLTYGQRVVRRDAGRLGKGLGNGHGVETKKVEWSRRSEPYHNERGSVAHAPGGM